MGAMSSSYPPTTLCASKPVMVSDDSPKIIAFSVWAYTEPSIGSKWIVPFTTIEWDLGIWYIPMMVFVMVAFASLFFFVADVIIRFAITTLLGIH